MTVSRYCSLSTTVARWRLSQRATGFDEADCATFLDSRHGRHFADDVLNALGDGDTLPNAIEAAVTRWQGYPPTLSARARYDIPAGVTYLQGFVAVAAFQ